MADKLTSIVESIRIDAAPDRVWTFLVDPEHVPSWLGCMRYQGVVGSVFYMQQDPEKRRTDDIAGATHCKILELTAPKRIVFSWYFPGSPETTVTISLEAAGTGGTSLTLEHSGWQQFDPDEIRAVRDALLGGWQSFVLPGLRDYVESR